MEFAQHVQKILFNHSTIIDSRIFVNDNENCYIRAFSLDNKFLFQFGSKGTENGQFQCPLFRQIPIWNRSQLVFNNLGYWNWQWMHLRCVFLVQHVAVSIHCSSRQMENTNLALFLPSWWNTSNVIFEFQVTYYGIPLQKTNNKKQIYFSSGYVIKLCLSVQTEMNSLSKANQSKCFTISVFNETYISVTWRKCHCQN